MDFTSDTDNQLMGYYQHFHDGSPVAVALVKELRRRGYEPKTIPFTTADGSRGHEAAVYKGNTRML